MSKRSAPAGRLPQNFLLAFGTVGQRDSSSGAVKVGMPPVGHARICNGNLVSRDVIFDITRCHDRSVPESSRPTGGGGTDDAGVGGLCRRRHGSGQSPMPTLGMAQPCCSRRLGRSSMTERELRSRVTQEVGDRDSDQRAIARAGDAEPLMTGLIIKG